MLKVVRFVDRANREQAQRSFSQVSAAEQQRHRINRWVSAFDQQGDHRTGSRVDQESGDWLCEQISAMGARPEKVQFSLPLVQIDECRVCLADIKIDAVPLFDCIFPVVSSINGRIGEIGSDADIGVIMAPPQAEPAQANQLYQSRRSSQHTAILVVTDSRFPETGIALQNADNYAQPFGPPVVQIANRYWVEIKRAMKAKDVVSVCLQARRTAGEAFNIQTQVSGSNPALDPIIIMTPRSSWWRSTSERAGGLVCFLEMIGKAVECNGERSLVFLANSGHELNHVGLASFLSERPGIEKSAHLWVHLGANFAAASPLGARLQFSDAVVQKAFIKLVEAFKSPVYSVKPELDRAVGEARNIHDAGGRYLSILAGNDLFHHPSDRWPGAVNIDNLEQWVCIFENLVPILTRKDAFRS